MNAQDRSLRRPPADRAALTLAVLRPPCWARWPAVLAALLPLAAAAQAAVPQPARPPLPAAVRPADTAVSPQARQLADWVALAGDHAGSAFIIVDKPRARVLVFDADARLRAQSAVLLGAALGDASVPGIGTRPMEQILPAERTTPAGRFVAERGRNAQGEDVVWVDYDAAVSMHRVRKGKPAERRAERLASAAIDDNRISYGCINVPVAFYEHAIQPIFAQRKAMVYVLPDVQALGAVFGGLRAASAQILAARSLPAPPRSAAGRLDTGPEGASRPGTRR